MMLLLLALGCTAAPQAAPSSEPSAGSQAEPSEAGTAEAPEAGAVPARPLPGSEPSTPAEQAAVEKARAAARTLGQTLKSELQAAIADGGPSRGIAVCNVRAPQVAAAVAQETGVRIGRSSLRLRNPDNAGPDWVRSWLQATGERKAEGLAPEARIVDVDGTPVARLIVPIPVEPVCLACHGPADTLAADVAAALAERYPQDAATGYAVGDLRGVLWAEAPVQTGGAAVGAESAGG
ncbi:MAG: DUF3365 domain-containing protein [Deltaproteobacteria bacterium]|nr:MAG: DUF3365 domain-containing protein [Deltaproteobacteria bacterium]